MESDSTSSPGSHFSDGRNPAQSSGHAPAPNSPGSAQSSASGNASPFTTAEFARMYEQGSRAAQGSRPAGEPRSPQSSSRPVSDPSRPQPVVPVPGAPRATGTTPAGPCRVVPGARDQSATRAQQPIGRLTSVPSPEDAPRPRTRRIDAVPPARQFTFEEDRPRRGRARVIARVVGVLVLLLIVFSGFCAFSLYSDAKAITSQSKEMIDRAKGISEQAKNKDADGIRATAGSLAQQASDMKKRTDGIAWQAASLLPVIGQDVISARTLVSEMDSLCQYAVVPGCDALAQMQSGQLIHDGTVDVATVKSISDTLTRITPQIRSSTNTIASLPKAHIGALSTAISKVRDLLKSMDGPLEQANNIAPLLPQMLGAGGQTRTYLIVAQNNAELRSTGGFPGSIGTLTLADGAIQLGSFTAAHDLTWYDQAGFGITDEERAIFGDRVGKIPGDTNFIPDFSRSSQLLSAMWTDQKGGAPIDGVIAIDPVFLQQMLALTGGVTAMNGQVVDGTNAAATLLHDSYQRLPTEYKDSFFGNVAALSFQKIMGSLGEISKLDFAKTMFDGMNKHHLQVWMVNGDEQTAMIKMGCSGTISQDKSAPALGVFAADDTASKISWYLSLDTAIGKEMSNADGTSTYEVTTTVKNNMNPAEAAGLVDYITGYNPAKRDVTDMINKIYLFAPAGGSITDLKQDGFSPEGYGLTEAAYEGRQVFFATIQTAAGQTTKFTYKVTVPAGAKTPLGLETTPTAQEVAGWK